MQGWEMTRKQWRKLGVRKDWLRESLVLNEEHGQQDEENHIADVINKDRVHKPHSSHHLLMK